MIGLFCFVLTVLGSPFESKLRLQAEDAVLRHQLMVLRRRLHGRVRFTNQDRWFLIRLYRWFPSILQVLTIIQPETLVRWHKAAVPRYMAEMLLGTFRAARRGDFAAVDPTLETLLGRRPQTMRDVLAATLARP
jgi:hypothetical protein